MFKNLKLILVFCILIFNLKVLTINNFTPGNLAVVRVPVADLLWESAYAIATADLGQTDATGTNLASVSDPIAIYNNLGLGDGNCLRAYQLLLHETVLILEEREAEVKIAVPHIFYLAGSKCEPVQRTHENLDQEYLNSFWTLKTNLIPVETLINLGMNLNNLPAPINFKIPDLAACNTNTVTLTKPVIDPVTQRSYSVGTRFKIIVFEKNCESGANLGLSVWSLESNNFPKLTQIILPADSYITYTPKNFTEQKQDFVNLIKSWAHLNTGFVPYVYSGASLITTCSTGQCPIKNSQNILGQPGYARENYTQEPSVGLDCSCLISRASQIVGIPYFYKNSATIERNLVEIQELADLEAGDIIWHTGHVMVISDVAQGLMVEARGYRQGFGCLHEIPISKIFYGVNSYADLLACIKKNIPVRTLDNQGNFFGQIARFKLLKFRPK